jgi:hypothetical protein
MNNCLKEATFLWTDSMVGFLSSLSAGLELAPFLSVSPRSYVKETLLIKVAINIITTAYMIDVYLLEFIARAFDVSLRIRSSHALIAEFISIVSRLCKPC